MSTNYQNLRVQRSLFSSPTRKRPNVENEINSGRGSGSEFEEESEEQVTIEFLQNRVQILESTLASFQIEVNGKFRLLEKLVLKEQAKSRKLKRLLELDDSFTSDFLEHWNDDGIGNITTDLNVPDFNQQKERDDSARDRCNDLQNRVEILRRKSARRKIIKTETGTGDNWYENGNALDEDIDDHDHNFTAHAAASEVDMEDPQRPKRIPGSKKNSFVWEHFTKYSDEEGNFWGKCKLCEAINLEKILRFSNGTTSTLIRHLRVKHEIYEPEKSHVHESSDPESSSYSPTKPINKLRLRSTVWKYFEKLTPVKARCSLCTDMAKIFAIRAGTTSSLIRHLRVHHEIVLTSKDKISVVGGGAEELGQEVDAEAEIETESAQIGDDENGGQGIGLGNQEELEIGNEEIIESEREVILNHNDY